MKIINPYFLDIYLEPLTGLGDDDEAVRHYQEMNINTEEQYRAIIRKTIKEYFDNLDEEKKSKSKMALSYYLSTRMIDFERIFDSCLLPFDAPKNAIDFLFGYGKNYSQMRVILSIPVYIKLSLIYMNPISH